MQSKSNSTQTFGSTLTADEGHFVPERSWPGPLNLRALIASLEPEISSEVNRLIKDRNVHAWLYNIASRVNGHHSFGAIVAEVGAELDDWLEPDKIRAIGGMFRRLAIRTTRDPAVCASPQPFRRTRGLLRR